MISRIANAELRRHARAHLRPHRLLATLAACVLLTVVAAVWTRALSGPVGALAFLRAVLTGQALVLMIAGGLACLQAIQRRGHSPTFDHERITGLSSIDLIVGKLFGAPLLAHVAALCLAPAAVAGALASDVGMLTLAGAWVVIWFGALAVHAFALLLALWMGTGAGPIAVLLFVAAMIFGSPSALLSPLAFAAGIGRELPSAVFFGVGLPYPFLAAVLFGVAAAWMLVPVAHNLKRDPGIHEILTPLQAVGVVLTVEVVVMGLHDWSARSAAQSHGHVLAFGAAAAWMLGLAMLRGFESSRRRSRKLVEPTGWLETTWPAPPLAGGLAVTGILAVLAAALGATNETVWSSWIGLFSTIYLSTWLARDLMCLQWIRLTGTSRPLLVGVLALFGAYGFLLLAFEVLAVPPYVAGMFSPTALRRLAAEGWSWPWVLALLVQAASAGVFAFLRFRQLVAVGASAGP